jgi:glycosyltransferase involved in cell wall biosynthesis
VEREPNGPVFSLIFPTYNPGPILERTWRELVQFLKRAPGDWEAIFVCDGCTDGTPARLTALARAEGGRIRILSHTPNRGKGYAVRRGLLAARGDWRIFTDVDLAYGFEDVLRLAEALQAGSPVAIASRAHPESQVALPAQLLGYAYRRHLQSLAFSALVRCLLPLKHRDTQAGLKGLCALATRTIVPHLTCDGFGFDCELLTACVHYGLAIREVPVGVRYENRASTTGFGAMRQMVKELWRIRRACRRLPPPEAKLVTEPSRQAA